MFVEKEHISINWISPICRTDSPPQNFDRVAGWIFYFQIRSPHLAGACISFQTKDRLPFSAACPSPPRYKKYQNSLFLVRFLTYPLTFNLLYFVLKKR